MKLSMVFPHMTTVYTNPIQLLTELLNSSQTSCSHYSSGFLFNQHTVFSHEWQNSILLYSWLIFHCVNIPHILFLFVLWWTVDCFLVLSIVNSDTINMVVWTFVLRCPFLIPMWMSWGWFCMIILLDVTIVETEKGIWSLFVISFYSRVIWKSQN
jgi:hypothetical protein